MLAITAVAVAAYAAFVGLEAPGSCGVPGGGPCNAAVPQFLVRVLPRKPESVAVCLRRERRYYEAGDSLLTQACKPGRADWYHAVVTYRGRDAAWVGCMVVGYDAGGKRLWPRSWAIPLIPFVPSPVAAVLRMHDGQTVSVDYHLPGARQGGPRGPVARYVGHCYAYAAEPS